MEKRIFIHHFEDFIKEQIKLINYGVTLNTIKTYQGRTENFRKFLEYTKQENITIGDITLRFLKDYESWLRTEKGFSNDYTMRNIQMVKRMIDLAVENDEIKNGLVNNFKFKYEKKKRRFYLDTNQLATIKNFEISDKSISRTRDAFLFSCYTGFAYCDIRNFKKDNIIKGKDGSLWLNIVRQKTKANNDTLLPLLPGAQEILERYNYTLPVDSNYIMNKNLRIIAKLTGIKTPLSTHSGRKTFGNILVNDFGVDIKTVSVMMGHKSLETTEAWYVDIREQKLARDMKDCISTIW